MARIGDIVLVLTSLLVLSTMAQDAVFSQDGTNLHITSPPGGSVIINGIDISQLFSMVTEQAKTIGSLQALVSAQNTTIQAQATALAGVQDNFTSLQSTTQSSISGVLANITVLQSTSASQTMSLSLLSSSLSNLLVTFANHTSTLASLQSSSAQLNSTITALQVNTSLLQSTSTGQSQSLNVIQNTISSIQQTTYNQNVTLMSLQSSDGAQNATIKTLQSNATATQTFIAMQTVTNSLAMANITTLDSAIRNSTNLTFKHLSFTAGNFTYFASAGMSYIQVEVIGGGGYLGGSGGYARVWLNATQVGRSQPVSVGFGGSGSSNPAGATTFGNFVTANGGSVGTGGAAVYGQCHAWSGATSGAGNFGGYPAPGGGAAGSTGQTGACYITEYILPV